MPVIEYRALPTNFVLCRYVKTFCTHKAVGKFTVYFPYILLVSALVLLSIEKIINKVFKYKSQLEGFYSLLATKKEEVGAIGKFCLNI